MEGPGPFTTCGLSDPTCMLICTHIRCDTLRLHLGASTVLVDCYGIYTLVRILSPKDPSGKFLYLFRGITSPRIRTPPS